MRTKRQLPSKVQVRERLEAITNSAIASDMLFSPNGKKWTVHYYNCTTHKHYKATINYGFLPSNIREVKERV